MRKIESRYALVYRRIFQIANLKRILVVVVGLFLFIGTGCNPQISLPDEGDGVQVPTEVVPETTASETPEPSTPTSSETATQPTAAIEERALAPVPTLLDPEQLPSVDPIVGGRAPDLTLNSLDQETIQISSLRGKYLLVNYWATWCAPCMEELPAFERIAQDYQAKNVLILTVNAITKDNIEEVKRIAQELNLHNPILLDEKEEFSESYRVRFFPTTFLIDHNGIIRFIILGSTTEEAFREKLDLLISGQW